MRGSHFASSASVSDSPMSERPESSLNGVVEGFYGRPWTARQRRCLFDWLRAAGLTAYLYAPKDDPKHRARWREPYGPTEAAELRALADECRQRGLQFVYAIAPGLDLVAARPEETATLIAKLRQARGLGALHSAVLWDDIPTALSAADRRAFGTHAAAQCAVTNRVFDALKRHEPATRLLFCPTVYCGRMATPSVRDSAYLREIGEKLHPGIEFLVDGPAHRFGGHSRPVDSRVESSDPPQAHCVGQSPCQRLRLEAPLSGALHGS